MEENGKNFDKIKVFSSDDEKLKILGELLSNKSSRDIIRLLIDKEMYTNEIAKKLELRPNLVIHHLQKMKSIGLIEITKKKRIQNGGEHKFFRIPNGMLIVPNESRDSVENRIIKRTFKSSMKFVTIGIAGGIVWLSNIVNYSNTKTVYPLPFGSDTHIDPLIPALMVIIIGLSIERIISIKKRKKG